MVQRSQGGARRAEDMSVSIRTMDLAYNKPVDAMALTNSRPTGTRQDEIRFCDNLHPQAALSFVTRKN